ncbi:unnamed protein product [Malus baccata var. baccata]
MTRSSHPIREHILDFDDDFERELRRKKKNLEPSKSSSNSKAEVEFEEEEPTARVGEVEEAMAQDNRTIKELSASGLDNAAPLCIQYPAAAQGKTEEFELKSSLLHHIPKYHGLSMEDPNKHLKEFEVVCSSMTPINVDGSILKMKAFPFSLMEKAKDWLDKKVDELEKQVGQITEFMGQFREQGKFLSSTVVNPKGGFESAKAITLRSGKHESSSQHTPLDAIKQVPRYAKFLKELCTTRKRISTKEVVKVGENVSAILQRKLPPKCKDLGSFTIPCVIGNTRFESAMLDLGASINVMPYSIYASMNLGELKNDGVIIQLADRSNAYPNGVLEDVLVQVNHLIFPTDFYVLEMDESDHALSLPILLGRPFMKTARTKIDVFNGTLTMEFDGEVINFNLSDSMKFPSENHSCFSIDIIDSLAQDHFDNLNDDALELVIAQGKNMKNIETATKETHNMHEDCIAVPPSEDIIEMVAALELLPS